MQALRTPLERLVRELRWFGVATELRALHVHTTPGSSELVRGRGHGRFGEDQLIFAEDLRMKIG